MQGKADGLKDLDGTVKKAAVKQKTGHDKYQTVSVRIDSLKECVSILDNLFASNPAAKQHSVNGTTAEKLLATCKQDIVNANASVAAEVHTTAQSYAAKFPAAKKKYDEAMKARKAKNKTANDSMGLAALELRGVENLVNVVAHNPDVASKPCGQMTCAAMAKEIQDMSKKLGAERDKTYDEGLDADEKEQAAFINAMTGGRKTVAKAQRGTPSLCDDKPADSKTCAKAKVWLYTITSTNPNGGSDITCEHRYVFAGTAMKSKSKKCH
jgi:hypothetical protein